MNKYSRVPTDTFQAKITGAGVLVTDFDPTTGTLVESNIIGATDGGLTFKDGLKMKDEAEGFDNLPNGVMEFMSIDNSDREITVSGTFKSANKALLKKLMAAADISGNKVTPRGNLLSTDFFTCWVLIDRGNVNTGANAGFLAIKLKNVLNTDGLQVKSVDEDTGEFAFNFRAHFSIANLDEVPYEVYAQDGGDPIPSIELNAQSGTVAVGSTLALTAATIPSNATVTWSSSDTDKATVSGGTVTGAAAGFAIITASITQDGVTYNDTCTVVVKAAS